LGQDNRRPVGKVSLAAKIAPVAHWNPVLFLDRAGCLSLFFKVGERKNEETDWRTFVKRSLDGGETWSVPEELVPGDLSGGRGPARNKPIQLMDGTIVAPASCEQRGWRFFADLSYDGGLIWSRTGFIPVASGGGNPASPQRVGVIQPAVWESAPGVVHMLCRSNTDRIYRSDSRDGGRTWCGLYPTALVHNNSGIDLVRLPDGSLILAHNPTVRNDSEKISGRHKLVLSFSRDNGGTWENMVVLENEHPNRIVDVASGRKHEYSYPAIILRRNGRLAVSYTYNRKNIAVVEASFVE